MDASTRLYKRLGEIPEDPNNPDSLEELLVCAFGAFERYYVCWKTVSGEFKQDGYDLPPALRDWLYPTDNTTRDFASLQVVFGRGEEYFASDKHGKLEYKEPEVKKPAEKEEEGKDRHPLRRSRTVSFMRPLSEISVRSEEPGRSVRSGSVSSQRASRPPSLSYEKSRTNSEVSFELRGQPPAARTGFVSQWTALGASAEAPTSPQKREIEEEVAIDAEEEEYVISLSPSRERKRGRQMEAPAAPPQPPVVHNTEPTYTTSRTPPPVNQQPSSFSLPTTSPPKPKPLPSTPQCTCAHHPRPTYANATTQTTPPASPPALRIDTSTPSYYSNYSAVSSSQDYEETPPVVMGRMMNYFSKPGYQLGDSLFSGYQPINWDSGYDEYQYTYEYRDEFGDEALR